jgi:hypothetical protein
MYLGIEVVDVEVVVAGVVGCGGGVVVLGVVVVVVLTRRPRSVPPSPSLVTQHREWSQQLCMSFPEVFVFAASARQLTVSWWLSA